MEAVLVSTIGTALKVLVSMWHLLQQHLIFNTMSNAAWWPSFTSPFCPGSLSSARSRLIQISLYKTAGGAKETCLFPSYFPLVMTRSTDQETTISVQIIL
jgi:hypothetical protein